MPAIFAQMNRKPSAPPSPLPTPLEDARLRAPARLTQRRDMVNIDTQCFLRITGFIAFIL
jgi:hypothetical protein